MLYFEKCTLRRGLKLLFDQATFTIHAGDKVGITGANGSGKSSLLALIKGEIEEDGGNFRIADKVAISHVSQETPAVATAAVEYVMQGDVELWQVQQSIASAEQDGSEGGAALIHLHETMEHIDGYTARARAARLMHGLGFTSEQEVKPVSGFSGGGVCV